MKELAEMKEVQKNKALPQDKANIDIGLFKKKIKKDEKMQKYKERKERED